MNIVKVSFIADNCESTLCKVPDSVRLKRDDMVFTLDRVNEKRIAVCLSDSENLSDNVIDMLGSNPLYICYSIGGLVKFYDFDGLEVPK